MQKAPYTCSLPTKSTNSVMLALGRPRFGDARLAVIQADQGTAKAWETALDGRTCGELATTAADTAGSFAVGMTDSLGRVFMAVDRFAKQTLCWRVIDGQMHYSERADILAAMHPLAEIDPQAVYDYVYFHVIPSPRTVFRGVHRLPPGHYLWFEQGIASVRPYWLPAFTEPVRADLGTLADKFRSLVRNAVANELDGSKPACFLSGGTDSSTVAGVLKDLVGRAATYSIGFDAEGYDEMHFARLVARRYGTEHHEYYVTPDDLMRSIPDVVAHYDQPFGNSSVLPAYYCARMARDSGVTRLLAGDGGDELFGGNVRYAKQRVFGFYDRVPGTLRNAVVEPLLEKTLLGTLPIARKGRSYVQQARVPLPDRMQQYNLLVRLGPNQVFTPDFLAQVDTDDTLRQQREVWQLPPGTPSTLNRILAYDWRYTLAEADLPKVRGATSLSGVEAGFPMLDNELADFSLDLPNHFKLNGSKLRWFFKEALRGFLPDEVLLKKKQGFGLPFGVWVTRHAALRAFAIDSLHALRARNIVQADFVDALLNEHLPTHPAYYGEMVWILMMLEQWMRGQDRKI